MTLTIESWRSSWNHLTFVELFKSSPKKAFEYRFKTTGTPIPEEYLDKTENIVETKELTRDELKEKLTTAWIDFQGNAKTEKLKELVLENNLM